MNVRKVACATFALFSLKVAVAGLSLRGGAGASVEIVEGSGRMVMSVSGVDLSYGKKYLFAGAERRNTPAGFFLICRPPPGFPQEYRRPNVTVDFSQTNGAVSVAFAIDGVGAEDGFRRGLCMFARRYAKGTGLSGTAAKRGYWVRDPNGGQPWEEPAGVVTAYTNGVGGLKYAYRPGEGANPGWQDGWRQHLMFIEDGAGRYVSRFTLLDAADAPDDRALQFAAAGRTIGLSVSTEKSYNLFLGGDAPAFSAEVFNAAKRSRMFDLTWWVRGFNGEIFSSGERRIAANPFEAVRTSVTFEPNEERGLYFVEAAVRDAADGAEAFARTNIARLPPYRFAGGPETSPFGIAAYWPLPDEESVQRLMDRMGVMWVRAGDARLQHPPRRANHHSNADVRKLKGKGRTAWIEGQLALCRERGNGYWEFANELNMSTAGIALKSHGIGRALLAPDYVDFVKEIDRVRREKGYTDVKLLSLGLAGYDGAFVNRIRELGAWDCFEGFCLHPGRGNFTVDYPFTAPEPWNKRRIDTEDVSKAERLEHSSFWNFYGAVRDAKAQIASFGKPMPLWLTEVYTPTFPNSFWEDSLRASAENTVLMYALIKAEKVKCGFYYQLFDGVWFDRLGINIKDREYHFGLMNRDMSPKPAFMAYCAIAEALDEARFIGWMEPSGKTHGLVFQSPHEAFAIIWDRTEGYVLTKRPPPGKRFRSPEAWEEHWRSRVAIRLPVKGKASVENVIGQKRKLASKDGWVEIDVGGAPVIVRGVDPGRVAVRR